MTLKNLVGNTTSQRAQTTNDIHTLCYEKLGLGVKYQIFYKKLVFEWKTNYFLGKDGFGKENQLFPRENEKKPFSGNYAAKVQNDGFFGFP